MSTEEDSRNIKSRGWPKPMEKNFRGVNKKLCYDDLGFECKEANDYVLEYKEGIDKNKNPYPKNFKIVADSLMEVCKSLNFGRCLVHPTMPGIQWDNDSSNTEEAKKEWKNRMWEKGNRQIKFKSSCKF